MVHNKISLERFFEVGGCCEVHCILQHETKWRIQYPKNVYEFNFLMHSVATQHTNFFWNGWAYQPLIVKENGRKTFHYLIASQSLRV